MQIRQQDTKRFSIELNNGKLKRRKKLEITVWLRSQKDIINESAKEIETKERTCSTVQIRQQDSKCFSIELNNGKFKRTRKLRSYCVVAKSERYY